MEKLAQNILDILKEDARTGAAQIAVMLGQSKDDVSAAIKKLEKDGVIVKYTVVLDTEKLEKECVQALIEVRVSPCKSQGFDAIAEEIYKFDEVKTLYLMSGGFDLTVFVEGKNLKEVAMFVSEKLSTLDSVLSTATHFILKKYKSNGVLLSGGAEVRRMAVHA